MYEYYYILRDFTTKLKRKPTILHLRNELYFGQACSSVFSRLTLN